MPRPRDWTHSLRRDLVTGFVGGAGAAAVMWLVYLAARWLL
jgi:hypothetical protein